MAARGGVALAREVAPLLADPLWVRIEGDAETGSTNDDARALAAGRGARGNGGRGESAERGQGAFGQGLGVARGRGVRLGRAAPPDELRR